MNDHTIFYYPYASFTDSQAPLLKAVALFFDKLYILDPEKASGGMIGAGPVAKDVALLESVGILERVAPEEVLHDYEKEITDAISADMLDPEFTNLCDSPGLPSLWQLALAKVPEGIRHDPKFQPIDDSMKNTLGGIASELSVAEYDEYRESSLGSIEYRYVDFPLKVGESIMLNHALFGALLHTDATPLTDDMFHNRVLDLKMNRAIQIPAIRKVLEDISRRRKLSTDLLAATTLMDKQLDLPMLSPNLPLEAVLEYRHDHNDDLQRTRERLGWLARRIKEEPWSGDFRSQLEDEVIPNIADELKECEKARTEWLKSERGRKVLNAAGILIEVATVIIPFVLKATPLAPVEITMGALGIAGGAAIPGLGWLLDWRDGKKTAHENGLHYLLDLKGTRHGH